MLTFVSCRACLGFPLLLSFFFLSPSRVSGRRPVRICGRPAFLITILPFISLRGRAEQRAGCCDCLHVGLDGRRMPC